MLDPKTKKRIDTARDILVGKVPDPKSQVEQITIAMIYKFMDDMDRKSEEMGGKTTFFTGTFKQYAWHKIFDPRLGGHERLSLYAEGVERMSANDKIPQLFRDIFKGAFLPYRDPETLNLFLKEINGFVYDHSERLGDAYEYLLSVLGSQGDAGQFRTPRHIIDFIVRMVDPKKKDTVLDPACGTAGFLISAYKHILNANKKDKAGDKLTGDEKERLTKNFCGYDIDPNMAKLSRANMYLHGFRQPNIHEYNTLQSEERWDDRYDVILANPPFMSPKGGIRPHKRFSINAKRSEVLFVDYIAEHLTKNGRAGVIVPEGIIFQGQTAYKALRKMLVEEYLWCVVSLPAGLFNPYSGVKTSILLMDKSLAKKRKEILFLKINNDGYDLGAQRREVEGSDIPEAERIIRQWHKKEQIEDSPLAHVVLRKKILGSGDVGLSGDKYREKKAVSNSEYPLVSLKHVVDTIAPPEKLQTQDFNDTGKYPIIDQSQSEIAGWSDKEEAVISKDLPLVIFGDHTCAVKFVDRPFVQGADGIKILKPSERLTPRFLFLWLTYRPLKSDGYKRHFAKLKEVEIPLPPIDVQKEIVAELDGYRKIIEGAKLIIDNYKPTFKIDPIWKIVKLGEMVTINNGQVLTNFDDGGKVACIKVSDMNLMENQTQIVTSSHWISSTEKKLLETYSIIFPKRGAAIATNKKRITSIPCLIDNNCMGITVVDRALLDPFYLFAFILNFDLRTISHSAGIALINNGDISDVDVPLPAIEVQREIVSRIESERSLVDSNKKLISIYEQKIQDRLSEIWGK